MVIQGSLEIWKYEKVLFAQVFGCDEATSRINLSRIDLTSRVGIQISAAGGSQAKVSGMVETENESGEGNQLQGNNRRSFSTDLQPSRESRVLSSQ